MITQISTIKGTILQNASTTLKQNTNTPRLCRSQRLFIRHISSATCLINQQGCIRENGTTRQSMKVYLLTPSGAVARAELLGGREDGIDGVPGGAGTAEIRDRRAVHLPPRNLQLVLHQLQAVGGVTVHVTVVHVHQAGGRVDVDANAWQNRVRCDFIFIYLTVRCDFTLRTMEARNHWLLRNTFKAL